MCQTELEAKGKALRQAIDDKYKELEAPGGAFFGPQQILMKSVDVKDIVSQYLESPQKTTTPKSCSLLEIWAYHE